MCLMLSAHPGIYLLIIIIIIIIKDLNNKITVHKSIRKRKHKSNNFKYKWLWDI